MVGWDNIDIVGNVGFSVLPRDTLVYDETVDQSTHLPTGGQLTTDSAHNAMGAPL